MKDQPFLMKLNGKSVNIHDSDTAEETLQKIYCKIKDSSEVEIDGHSRVYAQMTLINEIRNRNNARKTNKPSLSHILKVNRASNNFIDALMSVQTQD